MRTLIVMVKEPRAGRVKTRLGRDIGMVPAAWWFRHQSIRTLRRLVDLRWRTVLGLGAGWQINEHKAYGIELQAPKERVDRFEEAITVIRSLLDEDETSFHGTYYDLTAAPSDPSPVQSPLPILVGTGGNRMMRITATYGDGETFSDQRNVGVRPTPKTCAEPHVFVR